MSHDKPCASCGRQPAVGWGAIDTGEGDRFYCHGDGADCYVLAVMELAPGLADEVVAALASQRAFVYEDTPATGVAGSITP